MVPLRVGDHEKAPAGHGAIKPSVLQDQNGTPRTTKRHPRVMEPPRPLWLHGSPRPKWHPKDSEDVSPEQLEQGWMKALRRSSVWNCSLRLMGASNSQFASKSYISYAKTINIICNYNLWSTHRGIDVPFQLQIDVVDPYGASIFESGAFP